jgi:hypothetical protein
MHVTVNSMMSLSTVQLSNVHCNASAHITGGHKQGYGSLETIPALYGLWWNAPDYLGPTFSLWNYFLWNRPQQTIIKCGFSALWENMVAKDGLDVRTRCRVQTIDGLDPGKGKKVTYTETITTKDSLGRIKDEKTVVKTLEADFVVVCCQS